MDENDFDCQTSLGLEITLVFHAASNKVFVIRYTLLFKSTSRKDFFYYEVQKCADATK